MKWLSKKSAIIAAASLVLVAAAWWMHSRDSAKLSFAIAIVRPGDLDVRMPAIDGQELHLVCAAPRWSET